MEMSKENWNDIVVWMRENEMPHNPYEHESRKLECITNGDIEGLIKCQKEKWFGKLGIVGDTEIRQERNMGIIVLVLASRAAIKGGVLPEKAFSMADQFILDIERTEDARVVRKMVPEYELEFVRQVNMLKGKRGNFYIRKAKDYIYKNLHRKILMPDIAKAVGINEDYLSQLFRQQEGVSLSNYVLGEKIREAQYLLRYTNQTINQIASLLAFSSQSYFGSCFKKAIGLSPASFRREYGETEFFREN